MNIELRYFTGTGNSFRVIETCKAAFVQSGHFVNVAAITAEKSALPASDLLGLCFPVYAYGAPRLCRNYLKKIDSFREQQKVFVLVTAGDANESGFAIQECERILRRKNCDIVYSGVIEMPINWTTSPRPPFPPPPEEAVEIIAKGVRQTQGIAGDILNGVRKYHPFNYPVRCSRFKFYQDYLLFKYLGVQNSWRLFRVYSSCNGCRLCAKICPTHSIRLIHDKPVWSRTCEQCMRCVNFCPTGSVYQSSGGDTRGKNRYHEPGFKPLSADQHSC